MNSNAALKIPRASKKRKACNPVKGEREGSGKRSGKFRGNSKNKQSMEKTMDPKRTVKPAEGTAAGKRTNMRV